MISDKEGRVFVDSSGMKFQVKENGEWVTRLHVVDDLEEVPVLNIKRKFRVEFDPDDQRIVMRILLDHYIDLGPTISSDHVDCEAEEGAFNSLCAFMKDRMDFRATVIY